MTGRLESIKVNTVIKAQRILELMFDDNRRGWYETFFTYDGAFFVVYYQTKEA